MSWTQFSDLIDMDEPAYDDWKNAIDGNPNTPETAFKLAVMQIFETNDIKKLERLCLSVIDLARRSIECVEDSNADYGYRVACWRELMQMPADTPHLSDALVALGYGRDGLREVPDE